MIINITIKKNKSKYWKSLEKNIFHLETNQNVGFICYSKNRLWWHY